MAWETERATHIYQHDTGAVAQLAAQRAFNPSVPGSTPGGPTSSPSLRTTLDEVIARYLEHKKHDVSPATLASYEGHAKNVLRWLGNPTLAELPSALPRWANSEIERLAGRKHTVVKRIEAIIKPAVKHCYAQHGLGVPFVFPAVRSDYKSVGARERHLSREEFAALRAELPEACTVEEFERIDGRKVVARTFVGYPRAWCDVAVTTGLHASDVDTLTAGMIDLPAQTWLRDNSKGAQHYRPEHLTMTPYMVATFGAHIRAHRLKDGARLTTALTMTDVPPPEQWMRRRLLWAAHRIGLCRIEKSGTGSKRRHVIVEGWAPAPIDFRHTCAQWAQADGWTEAETSKWLANTDGIVRTVYAKLPVQEIARAVHRSRASSHRLLKITAQLADTARQPARSAVRGLGTSSLHRSNLRSKQPIHRRRNP